MTMTETIVKPGAGVIRETRILPGSECRAKKTDSGWVVEGYAAKFGVVSNDLGGFVERILPGAFRRAIDEKQDVAFLWMHDRRTIMARSTSGTLSLSEDAAGLRFEAKLADTQGGRDLGILIQRGDVDEMSFSFRAVRDEWDFGPAMAIRTLRDVDLFDVSAVDEGAYPDTELALRSLSAAREAAKPPVDMAIRARRLRLAEAEAVV